MESVLLTYLGIMKDKGTTVKVFLEGASPTQNKTMLSGKIKAFDDEALVLDECLIFLDRVISVAPYR